MNDKPAENAPLPAGPPEDRVVPRPEDFIGRIVDTDCQVDSIIAKGSKFVVFKLRNLKTGECDQVMKVLKEEFDPCTPLVEGLREAMIGMHEDPDRVLRICDRLLALDPKMEAAAFDKGVALLVKQEPGAALEAFNLALAIAPGDILNLVHGAACHAKLGEDEKMLRDLQAPGLHPQQLQQALLMVPALAQSIHHALLRLAKTGGNQKTARHILSQCFGPWVRFRLFLARRRNKRG